MIIDDTSFEQGIEEKDVYENKRERIKMNRIYTTKEDEKALYDPTTTLERLLDMAISNGKPATELVLEYLSKVRQQGDEKKYEILGRMESKYLNQVKKR